MSRIRHIVLGFALSLMSSCAIDRISPQDPTISIPDQSSEIFVGQLNIDGVRSALGKPLLASTYWGFDLFRAETEQTDVLIAITPWPIPFARITDKLYRYTLVSYDAKGLTKEVATGIFRRPADWRSATPIINDFRTLHIRANDLLFYADYFAPQENILVAPAARDSFLQLAHSSAGCTVVIGCGERGCGDQLAVDKEQIRRLLMRYYIGNYAFFRESNRDFWLQGMEHSKDWLEILVPLKLSAGEHILEFSAKHVGGKRSFRMMCQPGAVSYLTVSASDNNHIIDHKLVDWKIDQTDEMPRYFLLRPMVILYEGQWYVDMEP